MSINASLFALIQNEPYLGGLYAVQGNHLLNTVSYLNNYLERISAEESIPDEYLELKQQLNYLVAIENKVQDPKFESEHKTLSREVYEELSKLPNQEKLLLPGGWYNSDGGHALIYQLTRHPDGYHFTVFNAGDGIQYHAKKSSLEKELYNPTKSWNIPFPKTPKEENELILFLERLFKARLPANLQKQKKPIDGEVFYKEILSSISYANAYEIDSDPIPEFGYTGGQLFGTCSQRVLHQLFKINSRSAEQYQRFIFKFKQHALFDYSSACLKGLQPFNEAVADQIRIAIENNLKILNIEGLFSEQEISEQQIQCINLQKQLDLALVAPLQLAPRFIENPHSFSIKANPVQAKDFNQQSTNAANNYSALTPILNNGNKLISNLDQIILCIKNTSDPAARFLILQQVLLELPTTPSLPSETGFYAELKTMQDYHLFQEQLRTLQLYLFALEKHWLNEEQTPLMNIMLQCLMSLEIEVNSVVPQGSKLPSFKHFSSAIMSSLLSNQKYSVFNATNHPGFDKKLIELRTHFDTAYAPGSVEYYEYYNNILNTELKLKEELKTLYQTQFGSDTQELHTEIRKNDLGALFMIAQDYNKISALPAKFTPLIAQVKNHLTHENCLRTLLNPFYEKKYSPQFTVAISHKDFRINSGLFPTFVPFEILLTNLSSHKYGLTDSPAKRALKADLSEKSIYYETLIRKTANEIQLEPARLLDSSYLQQINQEDIIERDYFHLRSEPEFQIALTLDYFTRTIEHCADENNQRYIEANIFQPDLLLTAIENPEFLVQFDRFLQTGLRYFTERGQHTKHSSFYLRLNFLVSRYLYLNKDTRGAERLENLQKDIEKQLLLPNNPELNYFLNQYLFLILIERISQEKNPEQMLTQAYKTYVYIQGHSNPQILEDKAHRVEAELAGTKLKNLLSNQPNSLIEKLIIQALIDILNLDAQAIKLSGSIPIYKVQVLGSAKQYEFNALTGKLYEDQLSHHSLPLKMQHHPLINRLGLEPHSACLINANEDYMVLNQDQHKIFLHYKNQELLVQKEWTIAGIKATFELQALSKDHHAFHAKQTVNPIDSDLPKILKDGHMDFWRSTSNENMGIFVANNRPIYSHHDNKIWVLDEQGSETGQELISADGPLSIFKQFESSEFMLIHHQGSEDQIQLPRYKLNFTRKENRIIFSETGELVIDALSPIHPAVAGLQLKHNGHSRILIPVAPFYATERDALISAFYPVIHDKEGVVAQTYQDEDWSNHPTTQKPLWYYENSESYVSYQLKDDKPIADKITDALYLVYIYLATNQTEKAWDLLEECSTRLGGLSGDPKELHYIYWICKQLPHILPSDKSDYEKNQPKRRTPPYVACQLKAMSLLTDYLNQNGRFNFKTITSPTNANQLHNQLEQTKIEHFLTDLPKSIYTSFSHLQKVRRHLSQLFFYQLKIVNNY